MNREEIFEVFRNNEIVKVVFTKKNGDERTMICTKSDNQIPEKLRPKKDSIQNVNPNIVNVYDIEADGWRSFVIERLISIEADNTKRV